MKFVPKAVTQSAGRHILNAKQQSPHVFFAAGVIGVVGAAVLACRATLKLSPVLDDFKQDIEGVKSGAAELEEIGRRPSDGDIRKDLAYVYLRDSAKIVRLYAPAAVVGIVSVSALTGSHVALTRRNSALTATVVALHEAYNEYRDRVREEVGEDREKELHLGIQKQKVKGSDGKMITQHTFDPNAARLYARIFDEYNPNWKNNAEYNKTFLRAKQNYCNDMLQARGYIFLNEVYEELGMDHSKAGQFVGWIISDEGDNFVDFGIFGPEQTAFVNGWEPSIWLDFNVDGVITDKIGW